MTRVKICGNTNADDVKRAIQAGADYIGFIFAPSKRKISVEMAQSILRQIPDFSNFVGVFFNQPKKEVEAVAGELGIRILQFHGDETALYCHSFMEQGFEVIKTFHIKDAMSLKRLGEYNVSAFLFDTYSKDESGGTGVPFDWSLIENQAFIHEKLFLAGGLNIKNLPSAISRVRPFAVDVASGVESSPGKKDPQLLSQFIRIAKEASHPHGR